MKNSFSSIELFHLHMMKISHSSLWLRVFGESNKKSKMLLHLEQPVVCRMLLTQEIDTIRLTADLHLSVLIRVTVLKLGVQPTTSSSDLQLLMMLIRISVLVHHQSNSYLFNSNSRLIAAEVALIKMQSFLRDSEKEWDREVPEVSSVLRESSRSLMMMVQEISIKMSSLRLLRTTEFKLPPMKPWDSIVASISTEMELFPTMNSSEVLLVKWIRAEETLSRKLSTNLTKTEMESLKLMTLRESIMLSSTPMLNLVKRQKKRSLQNSWIPSKCTTTYNILTAIAETRRLLSMNSLSIIIMCLCLSKMIDTSSLWWQTHGTLTMSLMEEVLEENIDYHSFTILSLYSNI